MAFCAALSHDYWCRRAGLWGIALRKVVVWLVFGAVLGFGLAGPFAHESAAEPMGRAATALGQEVDQTVVAKVHGFHCRRVLGWDPVAGRYRMHSHKGICRNYRRCLRAQKRCIFLLGGGRKEWSYELFGFGAHRFTSCMVRAGCY